MSLPKCILIGTVALFSLIGIAAVTKKVAKRSDAQKTLSFTEESKSIASETPVVSIPRKTPEIAALAQTISSPASLPVKDDFPTIDRVYQLFSTGQSKLPIVETITYSSSVAWLKGRPAWISDYATHYNTSRHFIARSLNGKPNYFSQKISEGSCFNVFRKDKKIQFYLLVDVSRCKMGFYYVDGDTNERVLLKTYRVGLGRTDLGKPSGTLTPLGRYSLGDQVTVHTPGTMGFYQGKKVEMLQVFGTRWIPFGQEVERNTASAKGYGLQGAPWEADSRGELAEKTDVIGAYESDGCIRLAAQDMEELFSIVITKPTFIEIVRDFHEAKLPGVEVASPSR